MNNTDAVLYLCKCALRQQKGDLETISSFDLDAVYQLASRHTLAAIVGMALQQAGLELPQFKQAVSASLRKTMILDAEREAVLKKLEEAGIWYLPLKGAVLKEYYPSFGMREMSDNDILFDASRAEDVRSIMESLGFSTERFTDENNHDVYFKQPIVNFEMHRALFRDHVFHHTDRLNAYYKNVKSRLVKDEDKNFGFHFTNEDFYIYMIAHEYKHFIQGGTGLRSLVDTYVLLKHFDSLDWSYIRTECGKLGIEDFEKRNRDLSLSIFDSESVSEGELLEFFTDSGTYGNTENLFRYRLGKTDSKWSYIFHRIFIPMDAIQKLFPLFYRYKILLPLLPFYRLYCVAKNEKRTLGTELKILTKPRSKPEKRER